MTIHLEEALQTRLLPHSRLSPTSLERLLFKAFSECLIFFPLSSQQMHTDVATGQIHADLQDEVASVERVIAELQELGAGLRQQSL